MAMTPTITDDDKGTITVSVDGKAIRSWDYSDRASQRVAMSRAREYLEGWYDCLRYLEQARDG